MRIAVLVAGAVVLSGCAGTFRPFQSGSARPTRPAAAKAVSKPAVATPAAAETVSATEAVVPQKVAPAVEKPSAVPLMGFRPMRGQASGGI